MIIDESPFRYCRPNWNDLPNIEAFTILSEDKLGNRVSFNHHESLISNDKMNVESLFGPIHWLRQVHGNNIIELPFSKQIEGDGLFTQASDTPCAVVTADCLPIVFSDNLGQEIGITHCGRRGLSTEIIHKMVLTFSAPAEEIRAWIGPGIAKENYNVGFDIYNSFIRLNPSYETAFEVKNGDYLLDLYKLAKLQLQQVGIMKKNISGALWNTYSNQLFHSYRRDKDASGRMLTLVVKKKHNTQ